MKWTLRRWLIVLCCAGLAAGWTGGATAGAPQRTVTFEAEFSFTNPLFCGDAVIVEHDVGRITDMTFSNADGTDLRFTEHYAAVTGTITNTETGETLAYDTANLETDHLVLDPTTNSFTLTLHFSGLNFRVAGTNGPTVASAGLARETFTGTYEVVGGEIHLLSFDTADFFFTPGVVPLDAYLCA